MMQFRSVKGWLASYLAAHAAVGGFRVVGYNDSEIDASQLRGTNRLVQVFVKSGQFPKAGSFHGPVIHDVSMGVELLTAASASVDLTVLNDPDAEAGDIAAALAASHKAAKLADDDFDDLFEVVYQLLMANDQEDLGFPGEVANRWAASWTKGMPLTRGANVIISGTIEFSFRVAEDLLGVFPVVPTAGEAVRVAIDASANEDGTPQPGSAVLAGG